MRSNIYTGEIWTTHRNGWNFATKKIEMHCDFSKLNVFLNMDHSFGFPLSKEYRKGIIPVKNKWIGFIHNTILQPPHLNNTITLENVLSSNGLLHSLDKCLGLITFSDYVKNHLKTSLDGTVNIYSILHPANKNKSHFNIESFFKQKSIVFIGHWMRRFRRFFEADLDPFKKYILINSSTKNVLNAEGISTFAQSNMNYIEHLSNKEYDDLMRTSIVFLDYWDCNASNTILECIMMKTPFFVNKHPAIVEYVGEKYPLFYANIDDVKNFLSQKECIIQAHEYLNNLASSSLLGIDSFHNNLNNILQEI